MKKTVGIVGGGVGGLALACLLAERGHAVTVYERGELGGKLGRASLGGVEVSTGPSLFTFPGVWRRVLARLGEADPLDLQSLPSLGVHVVRGERVPLPVPEAHPLFPHWARYEAEVAPLAPHVETLLTTPPRFTNPGFLGASAALAAVIGPHFTAARWLAARAFPPSLRDALALHALGAGVGPRAGSALYALLPGLVAREVYRPRAGMFALVAALIDFASARGVELRPNAAVSRIDPDGGAVHLGGQVRRRDLLVSAIDPARLSALSGKALLGKACRPARRTVSGVALYARTPTELPPTTVVAPDDFAAFEAAMRVRALPRDTLALIHNYGHNHGDHLAVLLAAPPDGKKLGLDHPWARGQLGRLEALIGLPSLREAALLTPADYALGGAPGGALYGRAFPAWRSGPFHPERYRLSARLWQVGTGVHPGGGLPAVLGGALIVDELMAREAG